MSDVALIEEDIVVFPEELAFKEKDTSEQWFTIENYSEESVVFRIRVSVSNIFVLQAATGIVEAQHSVEVPVSLKKTLPSEFGHASELTIKLAVEFVAHTSDYESKGSKAFWSECGADALRKTIVCNVARTAAHKNSIHALDANKVGVFDHSHTDTANEPVCGAAMMEISPQSLDFEENQYQCEAPLILHNPSSNSVAYRVKPSASDEYIIARGNGVVLPGATSKIPVVLLSVPPPASKEEELVPHVSQLMVDLLDVGEEYSDKIAKSVWTVGADSVVHKTIDCVANRIRQSSAELVAVSPEVLTYQEGGDPLEDSIILKNPGFHSVAYTIKVSVSGLFAIPDSEGVIEPDETKSVLVLLKQFPKSTCLDQSRKRSDGATALAKFAVDLMDTDDSYYSSGPKAFWSKHSNSSIRRSVGSVAIPVRNVDKKNESTPVKNAASKVWAQSSSSFEAFSFQDDKLSSASECSPLSRVPEENQDSPTIRSKEDSMVGVPVLSVFPECLHFLEGDEPLVDTIILHNLGISNTAISDMKGPIAYRITSRTPSRYAFDNAMGVLEFDESIQVPVVLRTFPSSFSVDAPISEFSIDFTYCDILKYGSDAETFWSKHVGDKFIRKAVYCHAIGFDDRERKEKKLELEELSEAVIDYDGLSQFIKESGSTKEALESSVHSDEDCSPDSMTPAPVFTSEIKESHTGVPSTTVYPKCLFFLEGDEPMEDKITIQNTSGVPIVYRVYSSTPKKFIMPQKDGVLDPDETVSISVKLKSFPAHPPADESFEKFSLEFVIYDDSYFTMDPVLFWRDQGDMLLRKIVLSRAVSWEGREAIDARTSSFSKAEVPIEYNGYPQIPSGNDEVPNSPVEAVTSTSHKSDVGADSVVSDSVVEAPPALNTRRPSSLRDAAPNETEHNKKRRESMNVMLSELSTVIDEGVVLRKAEPKPSSTKKNDNSQPVFKNVMDEMQFFLKHANSLELDNVAAIEPAGDPDSPEKSENDTKTDTPTPLEEESSVAVTPVASVSIKSAPNLQLNGPISNLKSKPSAIVPFDIVATQRRVSWMRAGELLRVSPAILNFREVDEVMEAHLTLHNTALEPLLFRVRSSLVNMFKIIPSEGVLEEDDKISITITLKALPSDSFLLSLEDPSLIATFFIDVTECDDSYDTMGAAEYWDAYGSNCVCKTSKAKIIREESVPSTTAVVLDIPLSPPLASKSISAAAIRRHSLEPKEKAPDSQNRSPISLSREESFKDIRDAENVEVLPSCLKFIEGEERLMDTIILQNSSNKPIAFRILVSVPNLFVLKTSDGVMDPAQKLSIPVILKKIPPSVDVDQPLAKFAVEFLECDDSYYIMGSKSYWKVNCANAVRRSILSKALQPKFVSNESHSPPAGSSRRESFAGSTSKILLADTGSISPNSKSFFARRRSSMGGPNPMRNIEAETTNPNIPASAAVVVFPLCLQYFEGSEVLKDTMTLQNTSSKPVCFRIRVSVPHIFVVKHTEGVLDPAQKLSIPIVLKSFPQDCVDDADASLAKFAVEFLDCDDDYYIMGPKSFWTANASRAVRSSVQSKTVRSTNTPVADLEESFQVSPQCLFFNENDDPCQSAIELQNAGKINVVYRVRTSVPNLFVLKSSEGVLEPSQRISVPVVLKYIPSLGDGESGDELLSKFAIEFLECRDDYYIMGSKAYWKTHASQLLCKKVESRVMRNSTTEKTVIEKVEAVPIQDQLEVNPGCLVFRESDDAMRDTISLNNKSETKLVAFRVRVSVTKLFFLKITEGVLEPTQKLSIPVVLKSFPSVSNTNELLAKFAVEYIDCDEDYYMIGSKAFWKSHEASAQCKKILSKAISNVKLRDLQKLPPVETTIVSPSALLFKEHHLDESITIVNNGLITIAFRILVSVPNLFKLETTDGVLNPCQQIDLPISLPAFPAGDSTDPVLAKIAIECLECDDEYYIQGPKAYWAANNEKSFRKKVVAEREFRSGHIGNTDSLSHPAGISQPDDLSVIFRAAQEVEVTPKLLHFKVGDFASDNFIQLNNASRSAVAFRTRVSVQNMFVVQGGDGIVEGNDLCTISIAMKPSTIYESVEDIPVVKFAIELLEVDDRYRELGPKTFWKRYGPEGIRVSVLTSFQITNLRPVRKRVSSPSKVTWADESADESDRGSITSAVVAKSPNVEKHKKHIAEMESILNDLKGQLARESSKSRVSAEKDEYDSESSASLEPGNVNIEAILKIGKVLLKESVGLTADEESTQAALAEAPAESQHRDASRFQTRPPVINTAGKAEAPNVQPIVSPKPFTKPRGRLFELMIKNVSRDQLLSTEEAEELKQIRELMTKEHWDEWLNDARAEKKRRKLAGRTVPAVEIPIQKSKPDPVEDQDLAVQKEPAKKKGLNKKSLKSINRLVKKKEADRSIGVLKDALEHLWSNVIESTNVKSNDADAGVKKPTMEHPLQTPTVDTGFDDPSSTAKALLADIQARINSGKPDDKDGLKEKLAELENVVAGLGSSQSADLNRYSTGPFSDEAGSNSVLSSSPHFQQIYRQGSGNIDDGPFLESKDLYDDLGLFTPPHWKMQKGNTTSSFDMDALPNAASSPARKSTDKFSASLPIPRSNLGRSQSAPRLRPKAGTPNRTSGKSISQKIRGGQSAGRIDRWCLTIGSHLKAFDDYPIRVDTQVATVDVVWREKRYEMGGMWKCSDPLNRGASVLRRERFQFDDIFWGPQGAIKLGGTSRQRAVDAITRNTDLCFICLAAGERGDKKNSRGLMDPPMALLLGDQGGQGLVSAVVDEMFRYLGQTAQPPSHLMPSMETSYGRSAQTMQTSGVTASVILSAVIIRDGFISDLLTSPSDGGSGSVKRLPDGRNILNNVGRLRLHSTADFERVAGVLCGRRSALRQIAHSARAGAEDMDFDSAAAADENSCMLITVSVTGFSLSGRGEANYHFVCPCGDSWRLPGDEIYMLSESISALPHPSPASLMDNSILIQLLTEPDSRPTDFISVSSVVRSSQPSTSLGDETMSPSRGSALSAEAKDNMVQESLQALRVVTKLSLV